MRKRILLSLALACTAMLQFNCSGCGGGNDEEIQAFIPEDDLGSSNANYNFEAMNEVIASFSSPVEMAALLKDIEMPFTNRYLLDPDKVKEVTTLFKKSLGLGMLSVDLGYLNVYQKTSQILQYLVAVRQLTEELKLGQFFDFPTLKRLATSDDNIDTLQFMCTQSYRNMDAHLRDSQRSNLSALLVTGVWTESLYLLTQIEKEIKDQNGQYSSDLKDAIGQQKSVLNSLLPILRMFKDKDTNFGDLVKDLEELKDVLDVVNITVQVENSPDGSVINEYTVIEISDEDLSEIITATEKIRNKIIN